MRRVLIFTASFYAWAAQLQAHPHVFVDGGIDFVVEDGTKLTKLEITWLFDKFETLFLLSSSGVSLTEEGRLPQDAWSKLESEIGSWPDSFSGSAHVSVAGRPVPLSDPAQFDVRMVDTRLELSFTRTLAQPQPLSGVTLRTAFYEASYFYDFSITQSPRLLGQAETCTADVIPFVAGEKEKSIQKALQALGKEQTPDQPNVGALFADTVYLTCD